MENQISIASQFARRARRVGFTRCPPVPGATPAENNCSDVVVGDDVLREYLELIFVVGRETSAHQLYIR